MRQLSNSLRIDKPYSTRGAQQGTTTTTTNLWTDRAATTPPASSKARGKLRKADPKAALTTRNTERYQEVPAERVTRRERRKMDLDAAQCKIQSPPSSSILHYHPSKEPSTPRNAYTVRNRDSLSSILRYHPSPRLLTPKNAFTVQDLDLRSSISHYGPSPRPLTSKNAVS